ncbi:Rieske (2Fe-2S) protein [Pokkaliibacter sp. CJK22405]|uniref:Rieske (2Fe-2S) protein n=1 Tax=Pokkaliibacter sp. CJK22405 TaxID=3384615 RepID=UPI00398507C1
MGEDGTRFFLYAAAWHHTRPVSNVMRLLCSLDNLTQRQPTFLQSFLVYRQGEEVSVFRNRCPHAGKAIISSDADIPLSGEQLWRCSAHGALFDPVTGEGLSQVCLNAFLTPVTHQIDEHLQLWIDD